MKYQHVSVAMAAVALIVSGVTAASAQTSAKKPAARPAATSGAPASSAPALPMGPTIPGLCVLNRDAIIGYSVAGKFASGRLNQLHQQAEAEIANDRTGLEAEAKALQDQRATLPADQVQTREATLNQHVQSLQRKAQLYSAEMQQTQQKAFGTVFQAAEPIIRQSFVQHNCSLLLDGGNVIAASPSMELTKSVIEGLDTKLQSFNFERERIDPNQVPAAQR